MLATAIIVFREVLEAALIVGIVMAASQGVMRRGWWVGGGVAAGIVGAAAVAAGAETIAAAVAGIGQEVFNASILFAAVAMLGWHNIWMTRHGREMTLAANRLGVAVRAGTQPLWGLAAGVAAGAALYLGLVRIPLRHLFSVTAWLVLLLAAGMASQAAAFLLQADLLPPLGTTLWDTSFLLSDQSLVGRVLRTLIGYTAQPAGIQLVFYLATLLVIASLMRLVGGAPSAARARRGHAP